MNEPRRDDRALSRSDLDPDPIAQFRSWLDEAEASGIFLPNAIALATADAEGAPAARHVLLRGVDERGFVFYTNHESRKGRQLAENPRAAFSVYWRELDRQVNVIGMVSPTSAEESDAYFSTRPREARIGAWASRQSTVIRDRRELSDAYARADAEYSGEVPRPPYWGGYRLAHETVEFWQGRVHRLHDRFLYVRDRSSGWRIDRLSP
jgi:pyridoxamine 5'-phosphate oxidase